VKSLKDKVVFITGASSGIGRAAAYAFAEAGAKLILAARRKNAIDETAEDLKNKFGTECYTAELDVREQKKVQEMIESLPSEWKSIEVLVNNAGLSRGLSKLHEGELRDWEEMIDTNIKGLLYVSRAVIPLMVSNKKGHVINIGSIAGHEVYPGGNVYCASKHAVDALTKGMRMDLIDTPVRVTTIDPGLVETEFSIVRFRGDEKKAKAPYKGMTPLTPEDVADAILYAATRNENVVIVEMILLPKAQASSTLVHRE
jgi:NADP-dependent 3-hydroxy acid dehydrogenase YdfG